MDLMSRLKNQRAAIWVLAQQYGVVDLRVFGSAARGDTRPDSDLDLLVEFEHDVSLLDFIAFKQALEDLLGCAVDLTTSESLHQRIRAQVLAEAVPL